MNSKSQNYCSSGPKYEIMTDIYNNGNFDLFKHQLDDKQKIIILHILKNFPQEIKDQICEAIDLAIDQLLSEIDYGFYLDSNSEIDYDSCLEENE